MGHCSRTDALSTTWISFYEKGTNATKTKCLFTCQDHDLAPDRIKRGLVDFILGHDDLFGEDLSPWLCAVTKPDSANWRLWSKFVDVKVEPGEWIHYKYSNGRGFVTELDVCHM